MKTDTTINGRTPEEIKRSLKCRAMWGTPDCKMNCHECGTYVPGLNGSIMAAAALAYIQQLERERDAAVEDIHEAAMTGCLCYVCSHNEKGHCKAFDHGIFEATVMCGQYEWRGTQEVE